MLFRLCLLVFCSLAGATEVPAFHPNDRWLALGDSITHNGSYHRFVELFYCTRHPELKLQVHNAGVSGDTATGALRRWEWDCMRYRPTVVSVMFGMNDFQWKLYAEGKETPELQARRDRQLATYQKAMAALMGRFTAANLRSIVILPSPYDDTAELKVPKHTGAGDALARFAEQARMVASEKGIAVVNFSTPLRQINAERQKADPAFTIVGSDRIHPTKPSHLVMAYYFLKAQKAEQPVSALRLDAARGTVVEKERCEPADVKLLSGGGSFTLLENGLPFPVPGDVRSALKLVPFNKEFNQQLLRVDGLQPGTYQLSIDGTPVRTYSHSELAEGVNLALEEHTPQNRQAQQAWTLLNKKYETASKVRSIAALEHYASMEDVSGNIEQRLEARIVRLKGTPQEKSAVSQLATYRKEKPLESEFLAELERIQEEVWKTCQPQPHTYALHMIP